MYFKTNPQRDAIILGALMIALMLLVMSLLGGCAGRAESPVSPEPQPWWASLSDLGTTLTWVGGICAAGGIALRIVSLFYPPLAWVGGVAGLAAIGGGAVTVTGAACSWLAANPIAVLLVAVACVAGMVWWYWPRIRRVLGRRMDGKA